MKGLILAEKYYNEFGGRILSAAEALCPGLSNRLSIGADGDGYSGGKVYDFKKRHLEPVYSTFSGSSARKHQTGSCLANLNTIGDCMAALRQHNDNAHNPFATGSVSSVCMHYGGMVGDQTTADTTDLSGRALPIDSDVISDQCADCEMGAAAYYLYVPDDGSDAIVGILAQIGGVISVVKSGSAQVQPRFIMANDQIVPAESMSGFTFALSGAPTGTTVGASTGVISAGSTAGDGGELTVTYTVGSTTYTDVCNVSVVES